MVKVLYLSGKTVSGGGSLALGYHEVPGGIKTLLSFVEIITSAGIQGTDARTVINNGAPTSTQPESGSVALSNAYTIIVGSLATDSLVASDIIKIVYEGKLEYPVPT